MANRHEEIISNPADLTSGAYRNDSLIEKRRALYKYTSPRFIIEEEVIKHLDIHSDETVNVLDIGCGSGKLLTAMSAITPKASFVGIDISSKMFSLAKHDLQKKGLPVHFIAADAQYLPFSSEQFDKITAVHMLYHVPDIDKALSEMARVLAHDGTVVITANSIRSKPTLKKLKELSAQAMGREEIPEPTLRFNIENGVDMVKKYFRNVELQTYISKVVLSDAEPYIGYFDSTFDFWFPAPSSTEWQKSLETARDYMRKQIKEKGVFEEENIFGIITASKQKKYAQRN